MGVLSNPSDFAYKAASSPAVPGGKGPFMGHMVHGSSPRGAVSARARPPPRALAGSYPCSASGLGSPSQSPHGCPWGSGRGPLPAESTGRATSHSGVSCSRLLLLREPTRTQWWAHAQHLVRSTPSPAISAPCACAWATDLCGDRASSDARVGLDFNKPERSGRPAWLRLRWLSPVRGARGTLVRCPACHAESRPASRWAWEAL